ncbi:MAG: hypothetical protein DHS20C17_03740 [Cyclobacteriaceae bacterium]|nr:MAG: hypothetical protein DHS20C17_03740 [Cyclobacteriaceae bacterium]
MLLKATQKISLILIVLQLNAALATAQQPRQLSFTPQLLCIDNNEACAVGDINQDGLPDIVAGRLWYAAPDFVPRPVRPLELQGLEYAKNNGEHLWDMNADGWPDIVTSGYEEPSIRWFENPGLDYLNKGLEWEKHLLVKTEIIRSEIGLFEDLDADGVPEYILNSWHDPNPFHFWKLKAGGSGIEYATSILVGPRNGHGVGVGDINGDLRPDILFDEGWYQQPDDWETDWIWHKDWKLDDSSCPMLVQDVNKDGRNDIIFGRAHNYGLYWMEQGIPVGDSTVWIKLVIDDSWSQVHTMSWADLDGDGHGELITGKRVWAHLGKDPGANEPPVIYRYVWSSEKQIFERFEINIGEVSTGLFIQVADLNQDQKPDLVVAGRLGTFILWQD